VNARVAGLEVDLAFAARRLVVEVNGYRFHRTRKAFERDRERGAILAAAGYRVLRFSYQQVASRPESVAAALRSSA
jgi:very-short-patch-repair endonuclease